VYPRVEAEDWSNRDAAEPIDPIAGLVHGIGTRNSHDDIANGTEFNDQHTAG
jgi:hypothetical protein